MGGFETATTITLMNGVVVSIEAYNLAIDLERRGVTFRVGDDGGITCGPSENLTGPDRISIARLNRDLVRVALYVARAT